jgi:hypothetical protein
MSEQIEPGEGWRLIDKEKDTPMKGDQVCCGPGRWRDWQTWFKPFNKSVVYRRRIPAKPKAIWIDGHRVSFTEGSVHIGNKAYDYCFSSHTEDIRKLGEWCISVADWREAQDAGK